MENMNQELNAMEQALKNPLILREIFKHTGDNGKDLRVVCKLWNDLVLSHPDPKLCLRLDAMDAGDQSICCDSKPFQLLCLTMNPKLARSIGTEEAECPGGNNSRLRHRKEISAAAFAAKLLHLCDKFSDDVQYMDLNFPEKLGPTLYQMFQNCCPNLVQLDLRVWLDEAFEESQELGNIMTPLPLRPNLTDISMECFYGATLQQLGQLHLNSAPNLQNLLISHDFLPDLSRNTTLRCLNVQDFKMPANNSFNGLQMMLEHVKNHLEVLIFADELVGPVDDEIYDARGKPKLSFRMPVMPKLKHFTNEVIDVLTCGDALQDIGCQRLISLRSLKLSKRVRFDVDRSVDDLLYNISTCNNLFSGVTTLEILNVRDPVCLTTLKIPFPILESLEINTWAVINPLMELDSTLSACSSLRLHHLNLRLPSFPKKISDVVKCLANCRELFTTLQTFEVRCYEGGDEDDTTDDDIDVFKQVLTAMAGMKRAIIRYVKFGDEKGEIIQSFINEKGLPVQVEFKRK